MGTPAGAGETFALLENITAFKAGKGLNGQPEPPAGHGSPHMGKVIIDILFTDSKCLRKFPGADRAPFQQVNDCLSMRFHGYAGPHSR